MNRLLALLTLAGCGVAAFGTVAAAVPVAAGVDSRTMSGLLQVQLGNGGPNGPGSGIGGGTFRGGAPSAGAPFGAGVGAAGPRLPGRGASGLPAGSNSRPNGAKPAPMQPNGVRKIQ